MLMPVDIRQAEIDHGEFAREFLGQHLAVGEDD